MNIGLIIHSQTGHTYRVAQQLEEKLFELGHNAKLLRITPTDAKQMNVKLVKLESIPEIESYDALVIGCPVNGFSMSRAMGAYLMKVDSLKNKKVACLVTESFPYPFMGGNQTIKQMSKACEEKGAVPCGSAVVNWKGDLDKKIADAVDKISGLF